MDKQEIEDKIRKAYEIASSVSIAEESIKLEAFKYALGTAQKAVIDDKQPINQNIPQHVDDEIAKIATGLNVPFEIVELFYGLTDGELVLNLPPKVLPDSNSEAMRQIATLLAVGRKHAGLGLTTPFELIRSICDDNGRLDKKNFAAAMNTMKPKLVPAGKGSKDLVPKRPADELAHDLILKYNEQVG